MLEIGGGRSVTLSTAFSLIMREPQRYAELQSENPLIIADLAWPSVAEEIQLSGRLWLEQRVLSSSVRQLPYLLF